MLPLTKLEEAVNVHELASKRTPSELDDVKPGVEHVKKDLKEARKMLEFLVRRERKVDTHAEVSTRRLERLEREKEDEEDREHETNLEEALVDKTKVVKLVVDKWFFDRGFGFGKVPTGEIVFIHANAGRGTHDRNKCVGASRERRCSSPGRVSSQTSLGTRRVASREGQRESEQGGPAGETSSGTDC